MRFDRKIYFDSVRASLFAGNLVKRQVDGQNFVLDTWEKYVSDHDVRWLAYFLATAYHETSQEMWPIEEYSKGAGHPYGVPDPVTGQTYYGRGFVQLTWKENYKRADDELGLEPPCVKDASQQLDPTISARTGYRGMWEGWFRPPNTFSKYFSERTNDAYHARDIINGDMNVVPSWSYGVSIGNLVKGYHEKFLAALKAAEMMEPAPTPSPEQPVVIITVEGNAKVIVNGKVVT